MAKDAAITVRVPRELKRRLSLRAEREHRSISAQVQHELERAVAQEPDEPTTPREPALGLFQGARLPSEDDFREVRGALWRGLGRPDA